MSLLKAKTKPVTVVKNPEAPAQEEGNKKLPIVLGEIETGLDIPINHRGSKYEFGLDELAEKQSRFIAIPEGLEMATFKVALRNHIDAERTARQDRQNFIMRDAEKEINGEVVQGIRVFCVNSAEHPKRRVNKKAEQQQAA